MLTYAILTDADGWYSAGRMEELRGGQSEEERREALELLMRADHLEHFLGRYISAGVLLACSEGLL